MVVVDQSVAVPTRKVQALSFNESYSNVTGMRQLFTPSTLKALMPLGSALNGFLPGALGQTVKEVVRDAAAAGGKLLKEAGKTTGEKINGYFDALEESRKP
jgi:hypothetical protein